jgi:hypothetical protein
VLAVVRAAVSAEVMVAEPDRDSDREETKTGRRIRPKRD